MGNIKTIDVISAKSNDNVNLSELKVFSEKMKQKASYCDIAIDVISQAAENIIDEANINDINFTLKNISEYFSCILHNRHKLPSAILTGESNQYQYIIIISIDYSTCDDTDEDITDDMVLVDNFNVSDYRPDSTTSMVLRLSKSKTITFYQYVFQTKSWEVIDLMETTGYTEKQLANIINDNNDESVQVLSLYKTIYDDNLTDEELNAIMEDNKNVLVLNKLFCDKSSLSFIMNSNQKKNLCMVSNSDTNCNVITFDNGYYCVDICLFGKYIQTIYKTKNKEDIINFANILFDRVMKDDVVLDIFLSQYVYITFDIYGNVYTYIPNNRNELKLTKEESDVKAIICNMLQEELK